MSLRALQRGGGGLVSETFAATQPDLINHIINAVKCVHPTLPPSTTPFLSCFYQSPPPHLLIRFVKTIGEVFAANTDDEEMREAHILEATQDYEAALARVLPDAHKLVAAKRIRAAGSIAESKTDGIAIAPEFGHAAGETGIELPTLATMTTATTDMANPLTTLTAAQRGRHASVDIDSASAAGGTAAEGNEAKQEFGDDNSDSSAGHWL